MPALKRSGLVQFFVWVGALEGGFGGGVPQGCPPQKVNMSKKKQHPDHCLLKNP